MKLLKFILCMGIILFAFPAMSEIYKYVDEYGNTHFTDDFSKVPVEQRPTVDTSVEYKNDTDTEQIPNPDVSHETDDDLTDESVKEVEEIADDSEGQEEMVDLSEETDEEQIVAMDQETEDETDLLAVFDEAELEKDLNAIRNQLEELKKEIDGEYQDPVNLGPKLNTKYHEWDTYLAPDESYMIYCSTKPEGLGDDDLYVTFKQRDGSWSDPIHMGNEINSEKSENRPYVSPDGKYLFYASTVRGNRDIYWVDARIIEKLRPDENPPVLNARQEDILD